MNKKIEKKPCGKVKVRVRRASENSRALAQYESLSEGADLIDEVLTAALKAESDEKGTVQKEPAAEAESDESAKETVQPIVFVSAEKPETEEKAVSEVQNIEPETDAAEVSLSEVPDVTKKSKKSIFTRFSDMSLIRKILTVLCMVFCLWSLLPAIPGIVGIGLIAPLFIGLFALFTVTAWDFISSVKYWLWKALWVLIAVVAMAGIIAFAFVSGHMISASNNTVPANNNNVTVVVLGCKINGSEPSLMLKGRLDTAAEYLLTHPGVNCIVTGGAGDDENLPEAVVMKQYLVEKGVSASRIKIDDQSTSTRENLINALEVANANNYYTTFYIATDRFHQLRAGMICEKLGVTSYALSCETPWYLTMYYWFREMFALAYYTVTKN